MFKNTYQNGLLSIFFSCGSDPLAIWDMEVQNGHIKRLTDSEVNSVVLEIVSTNVATTYISCPKKNQVLGIRLPFLVMIVKNLKRYFSFEITILDDKNMRRRFRISNYQSTTKIKPFCTSMPIGLSGGWNQIQFNLADFTRRAYGTQYVESLRVQIHANARLRRIYFAERLYSEEELPQEYKLYLPLEHKVKKSKEKEKKEDKKIAAPIPAPPPADVVLPKPESKQVMVPDKVISKASTVTVTPVPTEEGEEKAPEGEEEAPQGEEKAPEGEEKAVEGEEIEAEQRVSSDQPAVEPTEENPEALDETGEAPTEDQRPEEPPGEEEPAPE